jgi:predicted ATPase/transcriptional regulator with XRE-family HTH domain
MDTFGEWIRQQRNTLRLTREQFASRVGCSVSLLRKIEDGERRPSIQIAELMANILDIPPTERSTFVKVARGELTVNRLPSIPIPITSSNVSPSLTTPHIKLPVLPTPLIGRQGELEELSRLLRDPQCRLLTLVGLGGIGKTRLAIETAGQLQDVFVDGVYFVPLAPVTTTRFIVPVIAEAIGFAFASTSPAEPKTQLFSYLKEKQILLLIDNLEHLLIEPGIEVLSELLAHALKVKCLVTSREVTGLQGEWVFEVNGLPIPDMGHLEVNVQDTSVELFLQRARRANVGFNATPEDYPAMVHICRLLDGMPLGIELAAAWVRTLSCDEIAVEIEHGLDFLSVLTRDIPARHRSMRAVFDHSWKLLTEEEQGVLLRLSVFKGGFRREAAEEVAGAMLPVLSTLVTKSLIRRSSLGRYDLHGLIRQFAADQLAERPDEQSATQARHGRYYLISFSQADERIRSSEQRETLEELSAEMDNFRAAWDWAVRHGEFGLIKQTLRTFTMLFDAYGWYQEGIDKLGVAISALETNDQYSLHDRTNRVALGHILACRSYIAFRMTQVELANEMLERSLEILRPLNEPHLLVESLTFLGLVMVWKGNYARALELFTEGLEAASMNSDQWFSALCLTHQANIRVMMGYHENGHKQLQSAVANWRAIGDIRFMAYALNLLSQSALALGRYAEAREALEECVALNMSVGDRWGLGFGYQGLGRVAQEQGQHAHAVDLYGEGLQIFSELGANRDVARALAEMGRSLLALGNVTEAGRVWHKAFQIATETQGAHVALEALVGIARLEAIQGRLEYALELLTIVLNNPASVQETKDRATHLSAELEVQLTTKQIETAQARARSKALEAVAEEVLK